MTPSGVAEVPRATGPTGPGDDDPLPGTKLGDYVVEAAVGWGGMGIVYRAVHPLIGRKVAVKVLRPEIASDPEQAARFLKEAQALSAVKHRGIIDIISFGTVPDGRQYMAMEFLDGESLEAVLQREGAMAPARALVLFDEVLDALSAAHKVGVVHRDLKPANVYISLQSNGSRTVKLVDFGLARRAELTDLHRFSGKASLLAGTPQYVSPEQATGQMATPRTDLYSLGVMMFELLTGTLPFEAPTVIELLKKQVQAPPPRLSSRVNGLPYELEQLVEQLLHKEPEKRPTSADVVRSALQRIGRQLREQATVVTELPLPRVDRDRSTRATRATPLPEADTQALAPRSSLLRQLGIGAGVVALGIFGLLVVHFTSRPAQQPVMHAPPPPVAVAPPIAPAPPEAPAPLAPPPPVEADVPPAPAPAPGDAELAAPPKKPAVKPKPRPPEAAPIPIPELCLADDWKKPLFRKLSEWQKAEWAAENPKGARAMDDLLPQVQRGKTPADCARILRDAKKLTTK